MLWLAVCWGFGAGLFVGALRVAAEGYVPAGLYNLVVRSILEAMLVYAAAALAGALLWLPLRPLARRWLDSPERLGLDWLFVSLPSWPLVALADPALLPSGGAAAFAVLGVGALAHAGLVIFLSRRQKLPRPGWRPAAVASTVVAGAAVFALGGPAPTGPNLLIVVLDTVRADRLSSYGYARETTPEIDSFARDAIRFTDFYSTSSWTIPSHASLFTGLFPSTHGATQVHLALDSRHTTLAEVLRDAGYRTWAASGNPFVDPGTNLVQGFESFVRTWATDGQPVRSLDAPHPAVSAFTAFLAATPPERPFFAFVNLMEAHAPYLPPPELQKRFTAAGVSDAQALRIAKKPWTDQYTGDPFTPKELAVVSDLYDGEVAYASVLFGRLVDALRKDGRLDDTFVVLTSDHGEHFGENGRIQHMFTLYNTAVHIPLIVRPPGGAGGEVTDDRSGQLVDLFPALLRALDVTPPNLEQQGLDLFDPHVRRERILSEYHHPDQVLGLFRPDELEEHRARIDPERRSLRALQSGGRRIIWSSDGRHELYDLAVDPGETHNLYDPGAPEPALLARLRESLYLGAGDRGRGAAAEDLDPAARKALRELGYIR